MLPCAPFSLAQRREERTCFEKYIPILDYGLQRLVHVAYKTGKKNPGVFFFIFFALNMYVDISSLAAESGLRRSYQCQSHIHESTSANLQPLMTFEHLTAVMRNINTRVPGPLGEREGEGGRGRGLVQKSEKRLPLVMKNSAYTSLAGVLWQLRLCLSNYETESFRAREWVGERGDEDKAMVETRNGWGNKAGKNTTDEGISGYKKSWANKGLQREWRDKNELRINVYAKIVKKRDKKENSWNGYEKRRVRKFPSHRQFQRGNRSRTNTIVTISWAPFSHCVFTPMGRSYSFT
jgi:hypothetical protein